MGYTQIDCMTYCNDINILYDYSKVLISYYDKLNIDAITHHNGAKPMKVTSIKVNGKKPSDDQLHNLSNQLFKLLRKAGFITQVDLASGKIGLHMKQCTIDVSILGRNADTGWTNGFGYGTKDRNSAKGWKYTTLPTWEEREDFNHIVNRFFDSKKITCRVVSGPFLVRCSKHGANPTDHYPEFSGWALVGGKIFEFAYRIDTNRIVKVTAYMEDEAKELLRAKSRERAAKARAEFKRAENASGGVIDSPKALRLVSK